MDDANLTQEKELLELATRGKTVISILRGIPLFEQRKPVGQLHTLPNQTSKTVAVDNGRSHSLKLDSHVDFDGAGAAMLTQMQAGRGGRWRTTMAAISLQSSTRSPADYVHVFIYIKR